MIFKLFVMLLIVFFIVLAIVGLKFDRSQIYQIYVKCSKERHTYAELDREKLITLYHLNPERWELQCSYEINYMLIYKGETTPVYVILNEEDFKWLLKEYKQYYKRKKEKKENTKQTKGLEEIIATSQKDIDSMHQKVADDFDAVMKQTKRIQLNLETGLKCGPHNEEGLYGPPENPKKVDLTTDTYGS